MTQYIKLFWNWIFNPDTRTEEIYDNDGGKINGKLDDVCYIEDEYYYEYDKEINDDDEEEDEMVVDTDINDLLIDKHLYFDNVNNNVKYNVNLN